jgi:SAM-dependent methyltransferase
VSVNPGVNPAAAQGFSAGADAYDRGRPSYPAAAVDHVVRQLRIGHGSRVIDLGAGTGKFTDLLLGTGADIVAVEPVPEMRAKLVAALPSVTALHGTSESIPLDDAAVDGVVAAQAFHWFDPGRAVPEMIRVLRPGGGVALVWNQRDESVPWVKDMSDITRWTVEAPYRRHADWAGIVADAARGRLTALELATFPYGQPVDRETLLDRVRSISYLASGPPEELAEILAKVLDRVRDFPEQFVLPYLTDVWTAHLSSA